MNHKCTLFHGSDHVIPAPEYGKGKLHNDYGRGFYCTEDIELTKEWSVTNPSLNGFVNVYEFDYTNLKILNLDNENILTWITILIHNRTFDVKGALASAAISYLSENFLIDYNNFDAIIGWRADDSYFAYANDFINGTISVQKLRKAMKLGNLGTQYVLKSKKAFSRIIFKESIEVPANRYYEKRILRDQEARDSYLYGDRNLFDANELYITDILRQEMKKDDPRI